MSPGLTTLGTLIARPEKSPRCHPRARPRLAASSLTVQSESALRPSGPPVVGARPAGACAAAGAAASAAQAPAAASRVLGDAVTFHARCPFNSRGRRSERRFERALARAGAREQLFQQLPRAGLRQGLVEVAALGRLHARGAALGARALADQAPRVLAELLEAR